MIPPPAVHLDLDGAWSHRKLSETIPDAAYLDCRHWGARLRYMSPPPVVEAFFEEVQPHLAPFILYGSGDYHYLTALWLRNLAQPFTLVSFDNHPDGDTRPPYWACGSWLSRALDLSAMESATVWGCGNFELEWPHRLFANYRGIRAGRLDVRAWAERLEPKSLKRWNHIRRETWRESFDEFASALAGRRIYVTVDIDCLAESDAATNWENGLFTAADVAWALCRLNASGTIVAGDLCGAFSPPEYARWPQRFAANFDHPHIEPPAPEAATERNRRSLGVIWPALTGRSHGNTGLSPIPFA